jgi:alpha-1,2-mannosyltransferase
MRRAASAPLIVLIGLAYVAAIGVNMVSITHHGIAVPAYRMDLDVYRIAARVLVHGGNLYGALPHTQEGTELLFTYPPIAAVVMVPLLALPLAVDGVLMGVATIALLAWVLRAVGVRTRVLVCVLPFALLLEPVRSTFGYGQINILLMAMVVADCLARKPKWPRGLLVGIAAAVKLTPLVFVLYFVLRRDRRGAVTSVLSFVGFTVLGFLLAWHDSVTYWTSAVFDTTRVGGLDYAGNESITGALARLTVGTHERTAVWAVLALIVLALTAVGMLRAFALGGAAGARIALLLNAFAGLLVSPISWSHHWVWCAPAIAVFAMTRERRWLVLAGVGLVLFAAGPQWWFPRLGHREDLWNWWEQLLADAYVLYAFAVLAVGALTGPQLELKRGIRVASTAATTQKPAATEQTTTIA